MYQMKMSKIVTISGAFVFASALSGPVLAAENAAGVKEYMVKTLETAKQAQAAAAAGNKEGCLGAIKQTKQFYKEITGDAAGKPLQDAMKKLKEGQAHCEAGNVHDAAPLLGEAVAGMEKVNAGIK
jgi:hypothetical protein